MPELRNYFQYLQITINNTSDTFLCVTLKTQCSLCLKILTQSSQRK